jgi:GGDEF domain-containing protein
MLKIGKQSSGPGNVRLPQISALPGADDLQFLLSKAQRNWRYSAELPFKIADNAPLFTVVVKCEVENGNPWWSLYKQAGETQGMLWSYASPDIYLVQNLIHAQVVDTDETGQLPASAFSGIDTSSAHIQSSFDPKRTYSAITGPAISQVMQVQIESTLEGDLKNMQMPALLQSVTMSQMTGRLEIWRGEVIAEAYFADGILLHASTGDAVGDNAVLSLLTWEEGVFRFYEGVKTEEATVTKRIDTLLMEGITLLDQTNYLRQAGLKNESYLLRLQKDLSVNDFVKTLSKAIKTDCKEEWSFYQHINDKTTLAQILHDWPMAKVQWTLTLYNLVLSGLVGMTDVVKLTGAALPEPILIDQTIVNNIARSLLRSETEITSYPAMLYFLEREFWRFQRGGQAFSLLVCEFLVSDPKEPQVLKSLPNQNLTDINARVLSTKRQLDLFTHFETFDFALLLPLTDVEGGAILARRLAKMMADIFVPNGRVVSYFGVSGIPEDCQDPGILLACAKRAKNKAKETGQQVLIFREVDKQ